MARVVIVRGSDCALAAPELMEAFSKYYPSDVQILDPAEVGEETEKLRGSYPVVAAGSRADRAVARARFGTEGVVCIGIAHGRMTLNDCPHDVDAVVVDIEGEGVYVALCLPAQEEIRVFFLESPGDVYSAPTTHFAGAVALTVRHLDSGRPNMLQ